MPIKKAIDPKLFDIRALDRNLKKGYITKKEYKQFLNAADDSAEKGSEFELDLNEFIGEREEKRIQNEQSQVARDQDLSPGPKEIPIGKKIK